MSTLDFYLERAAQCRREAEGTALANVKARSLSAAEAWDAMAARLRKTQIYRDGDADRKAAASKLKELDAHSSELPPPPIAAAAEAPLSA
jgi:hypothetical protein